jgi:hypothetical protein
MSQWRALSAIVEVRRRAADVVLLADLIVYGHGSEVEVAMRDLPDRLRSLQFRTLRCLAALESEGGRS